MNLENALDILKDEGYKFTAKRKDIIQVFVEENRYLTAKELLINMEPYYSGISFDTIYRNLHLFHELGILESTELNGEKHFRLKCNHEHHHHFIRRNCGITKEIEHCPMEKINNELKHYMVEDHKFEIYGVCPTCQ